MLVGNDGRPRVLDFGLVRGDAHELPVGADEADAGTALAHWQHFQLTRTGVIIGTPAYMSPEQLAGKAADARSDQFNLCVTLYEALYGHRPFQGKSVDELREAQNSGALVLPPRATRVPQYVHRALIRGLSYAPAERWPTVDALLAALARDPRQTWLRAGALTAALSVAAGVSYNVAAYQTAETQMCSGADDELADAWSPDRRDAVRVGFSAAGPLAAATLDRVLPRLDTYADAWTAMRTESCETHRRAEQSDALYDLRVRCLRDRRLGLQATVDLLQKPDPAVLEKAVELVAGLKPLATCADPDALAVAVPPPDDPQTAAAVAALEDRLPALEAQTRAGQYDTALAVATDLLREADALDYAPLTARVALARGNAEMEHTQPDAAAQDFERAASLAIRHGLPDVAAEALAKQIFVEGNLQAKFDRGLALANVADAFADRAPDRLRAQALLHNNLGTVYYTRRDFGPALAEYQQAVTLWEQVADAEINLALTLSNLSILLTDAGRVAESRAPIERAIALHTRTLGPDHPQTVTMQIHLGMHLHKISDYRGALALFQDAIPRLRATVGDHHRQAGNALYWSGMARRDLGDPQAAAEDFAAAVVAFRGTGNTSFQVGMALLEVGRTQNMLGNPTAAAAACTEARSFLRSLDAESEYPHRNTVCLAEAAYLQGDPERAQKLALEALAHADILRPEARGLARYLLARTAAQLGNRTSTEIRALATTAAEDLHDLDFYWPQTAALTAWMATLP